MASPYVHQPYGGITNYNGVSNGFVPQGKAVPMSPEEFNATFHGERWPAMIGQKGDRSDLGRVYYHADGRWVDTLDGTEWDGK